VAGDSVTSVVPPGYEDDGLSLTPPGDEDSPFAEAPAEARPRVRIVTLDQFVAVDEPGAEAIVGADGEALIPEGADVMVYGDGGAGKTTLCVDLACHLAAGDDWLGMPVTRPVRVLIVENEGPRARFRLKLRQKRDGWGGSPLEDRVLLWEEPWASFSFADQAHRETLAGAIRGAEVDVATVGPVTASGMLEAGTLQDVRMFAALLADVRALSGRDVTFVLVHHENKGGQVSGAWEGCGDTLLHLQGQGHGRARLYVQKARWASSQHATTLSLVWTDGESFAVEEAEEIDDEKLAEQILEAITEAPGVAWTKVEEQIKGIRNDRLRVIRDSLFAGSRIVNIAKKDGERVAIAECLERKPSRLYLADDPTIRHLTSRDLRPGRGAAGAQSAPPWGAGGEADLRPAPRPIRGAGVGAAQTPPVDEPEPGADPDAKSPDQEPEPGIDEEPEPGAVPILGDADLEGFLHLAVDNGHVTEEEALERLKLHSLVQAVEP
jgi:AAA domain